MVPENTKIVTDVGTDHAHLLLYLVTKQKCQRGIGVEVVRGPYEKAVSAYGLEDKIKIYFGNGLMPVPEEMLDTVVIAGMGGFTIQDIIRDSLEKISPHVTLILQPQNGQRELRQFLAETGFQFISEELVKDIFIYEIIVVRKNKGAAPFVLSETDKEVGPILRKKGGPLFQEYVEEKIKKWEDALQKIGETKAFSEHALEKEKEIHQKLWMLKEVEAEWK